VLYNLLRQLARYNLHFKLNLMCEVLTAKLHSEIVLNFVLKLAFDIIKYEFLFPAVPSHLTGGSHVL
jgi:hypothetical protein